MAIVPPLDEIPKLAGKLTNQLVELGLKEADKLIDQSLKVVQDSIQIPVKCKCDDPKIKKLKELSAPMPGRVLKIFVKEGDEIQFGDLRDRLKLFYGVDIIFVNREIEKCLFTGDLRGLDLFEQLDVAFLSIKARYEVRGSTIFVNGKSCK